VQLFIIYINDVVSISKILQVTLLYLNQRQKDQMLLKIF